MKKYLNFIPAALYYALIFYFSSRQFRIDTNISHFDKLLHGVEFSVLGFLLTFAFFKVTPAGFLGRSAGWGAATSLLLGAGDEFHQYFVPGRQCDVFDFLADAVGISLGVIIFVWLARKILMRTTKTKVVGLPESGRS